MPSRLRPIAGAIAVWTAFATQAPAQPAPASTPPPRTVDTGHRDQPLGAIARFPGDGAGAFATHRYPDLFAEQLGRSPAESRAKIETAFQQRWPTSPTGPTTTPAPKA